MKYKDFKTMSKDEMKALKGGNPPATETHCGTCTNMNGTPMEKANVVCSSFPVGTTCQDREGVYNDAMFCGTPSGDLITIECNHFS